MIHLLAQSLPEPPKADPLGLSTNTWFVVTFLVGGFVGWLVGLWKQSAEVRKLRTETEKLKSDQLKAAVDLLTKAQEARRAYTGACAKCTSSTRDVYKSIQGALGVGGTWDECNRARESLSAVICNEVLLCLLHYGEVKVLLTQRSSVPAFLAEEIIPEIKRIAGWVKVVNTAKLLEATGRTPLRVSNPTMMPFARLADGLDDGFGGAVKGKLSDAIGEVLAA